LCRYILYERPKERAFSRNKRCQLSIISVMNVHVCKGLIVLSGSA
jgi:hypothetical protein